ncbi:MAG: hypothetical protein FJ161_02720, partial [Gammaproteobacteria bacterium]|nr:hypothetical protein [Gammaproteobacteria bacterium]
DLRMEQQKVQSRNKADAKTWTVSELPQADQVFHRDRTASRTQVLAVYPDDAHHDRSWLCLSETVFYAESGGQVGDTGWIELEDGQKVPVYDTQKAHHLSMVQVGFGPAFWADHQNVTALLDSNRRANISIHHTATHLLHAAIHHVLGHSASQKGSRVESDRLRFDFAYDKPLTQEQKNAIEAFCREHIQMNHAVVTDLLSKEDAIARGALAFFGDKYGETVRMLSIGADVSKELCGGTHAPELNDLVAVLICSDEAVSAGVRRIQAVAGQSALDFLLASRSRCAAISSAMRVSDDLIVQTVQQLQTQLSTTQKSLIALRERAFVARLQSVQPIHRHDGTQCYVVEASTDEVQFFNQGNDLLSERHRLNNAPHTISIIWNQDEQGKITMQLCEFGAHSEKTHELNTLVDHLKVEYGFKGGGKVGRVQLGLQGQHDHAWSHILKSILKIT